MSYQRITSNIILKLESSIDALSNLVLDEAFRVEREKRESLKLPTEEEKNQKWQDVAETDKSINYYAMMNTLRNALSIVKNEVEEISKKK